MATPLLGLALPDQGSNTGIWGTLVNNSITSLLDSAVAGTTTLSADSDVTLTTTEEAANQAREAILLWTAAGTTTRNITAPYRSKAYIVINASGTQSIVLRAYTGSVYTTGVTLVAGEKALCAWNGSDFVKVSTTVNSGVTSVTATSPVASSGGATPVISMAAATSSANGYLTSTDWTTFNSKQGTITLTTTGTSGAATFVGTTLNIPQYAGVASVSGTAPVVSSGGATPVISMAAATGSVNGYLTSTDWTTFNSKQAAGTYITAVTATSPVVSSGGVTPVISMAAATSSVNGYLTSTDWSTFNGKQSAITLTTTGTSGAATLVGSTLNIPQYSGGGSGSPAGSNTQIQYNNSGSFGASSAFTFDGAILNVNGVKVGRGASAIASNTAVGDGALTSNTTGTNNTAVGSGAGYSMAGGAENTFFGYQAGYSNSSGTNNVAVGSQALKNGGSGSNCIAIGVSALVSCYGAQNIAIGTSVLSGITNANANIGIGISALFNQTASDNNVAVGGFAGNQITTGGNNICIGYNAGADAVRTITTASNQIVMGNNSNTNAYIKISWTTTSDARDKTSFAPVPHGLAFVTSLVPTAYQFRVSREDETPSGQVRYGFKAQDILAAEGPNPVIIDDSDPENLKYNQDSMIAVLVNAIKELKAELDLVKAELAAK